MEEEEEEKGWSCSRCTLLNSSSSLYCDACGHRVHHEEDQVVDLTTEPHSPPSSLPWEPFYHFKSPPLREVSPQIDQRNHLSLADIVDGAEAVVLTNYLVDIEFLANQCPSLLNPEVNVLLLHGSKGKTEELNEERRNLGIFHWVVSEVSMREERFGTHHSKIILAFFSSGVRVCVMTANLTETDTFFLTQGIFVQDFPFLIRNTKESLKEEVGCENKELERFMFRSPLLKYFAHVKGNISHAASIALNQRMSQLQDVDFSHCKVALIPARPGKHEDNRHMWGILRLSSVLAKYGHCEHSDDKTLVMQCSSLGSMGKNELYIDELSDAMYTVAGRSSKNVGDSQEDRNIQIVWPSVRCISQSYLGYQSGGSIPCNSGTIETETPNSKKCIKKGFANRFRRWEAGPSGREKFPAHMKCYFRYCATDNSDQGASSLLPTEYNSSSSELHWFVLTSSNLSQAAWGKKQRNGHVLYIKSYEMGVLYLPSWLERQYQVYGETAKEKKFSCTPLHPILGLYSPGDPEERVDIETDTPRETGKTKKRKISDICERRQKCWSKIKFTTATCTDLKLATPASVSSSSQVEEVVFSIPFQIPCPRYTFVGTDTPWTWDKQYTAPDTNGNTWPMS